MRRRERNQYFESLKENGISNEEYYSAYKRVKRIKGFYIHLLVYILVNLFLIFNQRFKHTNNTNEMFFEWHTYSTALFWGIGLVAHGVSVFGRDIFFGQNWEEKKIKEFMEKDRNFK